jgi:hypothetical protein
LACLVTCFDRCTTPAAALAAAALRATPGGATPGRAPPGQAIPARALPGRATPTSGTSPSTPLAGGVTIVVGYTVGGEGERASTLQTKIHIASGTRVPWLVPCNVACGTFFFFSQVARCTVAPQDRRGLLWHKVQVSSTHRPPLSRTSQSQH